jgi:hypothetical protein
MSREPLTEKLVSDLLYDSEGALLDFKRDQCRFIGASNVD